MRGFLIDTFEHVLAALIFVGSFGDVVSTRLITPTLLLEANPFVRRRPRLSIWMRLPLCAVPYYSTALGVTAAVAFLLVAGGNFVRGWFAHTLGEAETLEVLKRAASRGSLR